MVIRRILCLNSLGIVLLALFFFIYPAGRAVWESVFWNTLPGYWRHAASRAEEEIAG